MNNNLRMSGATFLMLKKSADRRQIEALEKAFERADVNGDGKLSVEEYYRILKDHGISCSKEEILHIIQIADKDHDGFISREEFLGVGSKKTGSVIKAEADRLADEKAIKAFNAFDKNHDGFITKEEMKKISKNLTKEQIDAVFARNDENQDGKLTLEEFQEMMAHRRNNN